MGEKANLQALLSALALGIGAFLALFGHRCSNLASRENPRLETPLGTCKSHAWAAASDRVLSGRYPHTTEFTIGAAVFGIFCWAHLLPYFGNPRNSQLKQCSCESALIGENLVVPAADGSLLVFYVFGIVVVLVGGLVGGVFGVLLPKVTIGSALGVLVALFITLVRFC
jgi:hypothetical protein